MPFVNRTHPHARGLKAYWLMNEGCGNTVADLTGNGHTGASLGDTLWIAGPEGPAYNLFGTNQVPRGIEVTNFGDVLGNFTVVTKVRWNSAFYPNIAQYIHARRTIGEAYPFLLSMHGNLETFHYYSGDEWVNTSVSFVYTVWQTVAFVYNGSNIYVYIDGVQQYTQAESITLAGNYLGIGFDGIGTGGEGNVSMSWQAVYGRALSASEVASLYANPFAMFERPTPEMWVSAGEEPPAGTGYVFTIMMSSIPVWLVVGLAISMGYTNVKGKVA